MPASSPQPSALGADLPFTAPALLAPMEGVTDPLFRALVLARNPVDRLGGATTEFVRVVDQGLGVKRMRAELAEENYGRPVGLQLMGRELDAVAASARAAAEAGAPFVDLNFGCPAKGALRGCAGSALLDDPAALGALVRVVADAVAPSGVPVTAKLRAGGEDDTRLEELVAAACEGGARLVTIHCRTRREGYRDTADWGRLRRAVAAAAPFGVPVCGNGGVEAHADLERLRAETGCAFVMVGRAALRDPWIFGGHRASADEVRTFFEEYQAGLVARGAATRGGRMGSRLKQLTSYWEAGPPGLIADVRRELLRLPDDSAVLAAIRQRCHSPPI